MVLWVNVGSPMKSLVTTLAVVFVVFFPSIAVWAEKNVLVIQVNDNQNRPVEGLEIKTTGASESGITDRKGLARIKLDAQAKNWVTLQIVKSPPAKDFVLISPWDSRTLVPSFENESTDVVTIIVADRGDPAMLENGKVLAALVARINKANIPKAKELFEEKGDYPEAEALYRRALAIDKTALGPDHPEVAADLSNLGGAEDR